MNAREAVARALAAHNNTGWLSEPALPFANEKWLTEADAALTALGLQVGGPNVVAPKEPTEAMQVDGGLKAEEMMFGVDPDYTGVIFKDMANIYRVMLAAVEDT